MFDLILKTTDYPAIVYHYSSYIEAVEALNNPPRYSETIELWDRKINYLVVEAGNIEDCYDNDYYVDN
jgi:hypothetical protein